MEGGVGIVVDVIVLVVLLLVVVVVIVVVVIVVVVVVLVVLVVVVVVIVELVDWKSLDTANERQQDGMDRSNRNVIDTDYGRNADAVPLSSRTNGSRQ
ncbi:hypothetical protein ElyMa_000721200 [Elysia marginata]|uniref:ABC transmembrane type-1 domain-containing protein n=1 Tax=Elysia marginata TaxID=1093978 RepID=A0AAV4GL32_9GAST|nr:hypothetical protein ElyMa_000721200 [Elysia marginata]